MTFWAYLWDILMFRHGYGSLDALEAFVSVVTWIAALAAAAMVIGLLAWLICTIRRSIAYDYEILKLPAQVTGKKYESGHATYIYNPALSGLLLYPQSTGFNVSIITDNGLTGTIDDRELYDWAQKGSRLRVTMKVGRSRDLERTIKYCRIISYSF